MSHILFQGVCLDASQLELDYVQPDDEYVRWVKYSKRSKILNTFLFLFSNKMLVFRAGIHKLLVRIANREDCSEAV